MPAAGSAAQQLQARSTTLLATSMQQLTVSGMLGAGGLPLSMLHFVSFFEDVASSVAHRYLKL